MNTLNAELQAQVQSLAELCCISLERKQINLEDLAEPIIKALVAGGFHRASDVNLQARIEHVVLASCAKKAIHRKRELSALAGQLQDAMNELVTWKTSNPAKAFPSKAANISSATNA